MIVYKSKHMAIDCQLARKKDFEKEEETSSYRIHTEPGFVGEMNINIYIQCNGTLKHHSFCFSVVDKNLLKDKPTELGLYYRYDFSDRSVYNVINFLESLGYKSNIDIIGNIKESINCEFDNICGNMEVEEE